MNMGPFAPYLGAVAAIVLGIFIWIIVDKPDKEGGKDGN